MSTIKSSDEHLTLNADGSSKDIKFQANGVEKASISSAGAFTSTTIDATKLTGNLPAVNGSALTNLTAANLTGALPAISGANLTGVGGNLKTITAVTTDGGSFTESAGNNKTSGSGFTITTGADTNRIAVHLGFFSMVYDSNGAAPYGFNSIHFHSSMNANETPSGAVIVPEMSYFGQHAFYSTSSRHDIYNNHSLHGIATVSPSTTYYIQLCVRRGQYSDYINVNEPTGFIMEYAQ